MIEKLPGTHLLEMKKKKTSMRIEKRQRNADR